MRSSDLLAHVGSREFCVLATPIAEGAALKLAERMRGIVSRFADNYFFSMPTPKFSLKLQRMIACEAITAANVAKATSG